jgi:hypothetical protein
LYAAVYDRDRAFAGTCGSGTSSWVELTEDDLLTRPQDSTFPTLTLPQLMLTERVYPDPNQDDVTRAERDDPTDS